MTPARKTSRFVICLENEGHQASLEVRKVYCRIAPEPGDPKSMVRVVDESGEDYLYPAAWFAPIALRPRAVAVMASA